MITRGREVCISLPLQSLPLHIFTLAYPYLGVFISFWNIATSFFVRLAKSHPLQTQDAAFVASISIIFFFCLKCTNCKRCFYNLLPKLWPYIFSSAIPIGIILKRKPGWDVTSLWISQPSRILPVLFMMIAWASCLRSGVHLPLWLADDCDDDEEEKEDGNDVGDVDDDDDDDCDRRPACP